MCVPLSCVGEWFASVCFSPRRSEGTEVALRFATSSLRRSAGGRQYQGASTCETVWCGFKLSWQPALGGSEIQLAREKTARISISFVFKGGFEIRAPVADSLERAQVQRRNHSREWTAAGDVVWSFECCRDQW